MGVVTVVNVDLFWGGVGGWGGGWGGFFFKQKTAYEIVSRDWSSDVCSSDLASDSSDDYDSVIDRQLAAVRQQVIEAANQDGRDVTQILVHRSMLTTGAEDVIALEDVQILERYVAVAVCDQDCDALDLQIDARMVSDGPVAIAETTERTDFPLLEFVGRPCSDHSATVSMSKCSSEPCFYGLVVYALSDKN